MPICSFFKDQVYTASTVVFFPFVSTILSLLDVVLMTELEDLGLRMRPG